MKIVDIFAIVKGALASVQYDSYETHEFERVFDFFNDPVELFEFFEANQIDLQSGFYGNISIKEALNRTRKEAQELEEKILELAEGGVENPRETLSTLFEPLSDNEIDHRGFERDKAYGLSRKSWIRVYAIRVDLNKFVVSGGTIKLTKKMHGRAHTEQELEKLDITKKYLEEAEIDIDDFFTTK
ncbi:MAG: hypothetical protein ACXIUD_02180 [Mongoliitalea sp.]